MARQNKRVAALQSRARFKIFDPKHEALLLAYYAEDSPTRGNGEQSAIKVGYPAITARTVASQILKRYDKRKFQDALKAVGVNNLMMAHRVRRMILNGADKDAIAAIRLALAAKGEVTDESRGGVTVNANAPVMVIVGASQERIRALRNAEPQLPREVQEHLSEQRGDAKLALLREGETFVKRPHSKAKVDDGEVEILDVESSPVECIDETPTGAGRRASSAGHGDPQEPGVAGPAQST